MARPLRIEYPGAFYHVTSRGNERKDIFKSQRDREKFLEYLESATQRYKAVIHAYCLMSNHYHLLLETPDGNLSQIMRHINGAYTTYFNVKRKRAGHLLQGRYKAFLVEADEYLAELSCYLHLNPVRAGIVEKPHMHKWSSYGCCAGHQKRPKWLTTGFILSCYGRNDADAQKSYRSFVEGRISEESESPLTKAVGASILGTPSFVDEVMAKYLQGKEDANVPALRQLTRRLSVEEIIRAVTAAFPDDEKRVRNVSMHICHRHSGLALRQIGEQFQVRDTAITEASRRVMKKLEMDEQLCTAVEEIRRRFQL